MNWVQKLFIDTDLIKWKIRRLEQLIDAAKKCGKDVSEYEVEINRLKDILK